jgi:hypothetical protein
MTFIHVEPARDEGWNKDAAVRASETTRVSELLSRLLGDLARLDTPSQTSFDEYLDTEALDAVRNNPQTYHLIGRAAHSLADGGERCVTAAYWREDGAGQVDVELEVADDEVVWGPTLAPVPAGPLSHHLSATVDCREGRIERLELR